MYIYIVHVHVLVQVHVPLISGGAYGVAEGDREVTSLAEGVGVGRGEDHGGRERGAGRVPLGPDRGKLPYQLRGRVGQVDTVRRCKVPGGREGGREGGRVVMDDIQDVLHLYVCIRTYILLLLKRAFGFLHSFGEVTVSLDFERNQRL